MRILDSISSPEDLKKLNIEDQIKLAEEIRQNIFDVTKNNGGHLASNLGIVETIIALINNFDFPKDKIVFDVGHQCYAYKILTDRKASFGSIRTRNGISGFPDKTESEFDTFTSGHAGSSVAQGLGLCMARDVLKEDYVVVSLVGDGALINGLNLEAITATTTKPKNYIVILNDNGMSISKNTNGFYRFLSKKTISMGYVKRKKHFKKVFKNSFIMKFLRGFRSFIKRLFNGTTFFEDYGFKYVGVTDGNNLNELNSTIQKVKNYAKEKAVLLHISTVKGKGDVNCEKHADVYHGVNKVSNEKSKSFASIVPSVLDELVAKDNTIITITAGMKDGTGLKLFEEKHPGNFIDVGIAEEYAVSLASGLATGKLKPILFIYSTFLQRAYDEIMQDICLQNLPVIFCIDRSGLVGEDGKTHQGTFAISFLSHIPNMRIFYVGDETEFKNAISYCISLKSPCAVLYPKMQSELKTVPFNNGAWQKIDSGFLSGKEQYESGTTDTDKRKPEEDNKNCVILAVGHRMLNIALNVQRRVKSTDVYNVCAVKPLDEKVLQKIKGRKIVTLEENVLAGGFGSLVSAYYAKDTHTKVVSFGIKDEFVAHGDVKSQLEDCGITEENIIKEIVE